MKKPTFKELLPHHGYFGTMSWTVHFPNGKVESGKLVDRTKEERADYRKALADARLFIKGARIFFKEFFKRSAMNDMAVAFTGNPNRTSINFSRLLRPDDMIAIAKGATYQLTNYVDGSVTLFVHR